MGFTLPFSEERKVGGEFTCYGAPVKILDFVEILLSENRRQEHINKNLRWELARMTEKLEAAQQQVEKKVKIPKVKPHLHLVKDGDGSEPPKSDNWLADVPVGTVFASRTVGKRWGRSLDIVGVQFQGKQVTKLEVRREDRQWDNYIEWVISDEYSNDHELIEILIRPAEEEEVPAQEEPASFHADHE